MADYNFWADLLDTWQSTSDGIKALALVTPPLFFVSLIALLLGHRARMKASPFPSTQVQPSVSATDREALTILTQLQQGLRELKLLHGQNGFKLLVAQTQGNADDLDLMTKFARSCWRNMSGAAVPMMRSSACVITSRREEHRRSHDCLRHP